jgi:hypothetical protein
LDVVDELEALLSLCDDLAERKDDDPGVPLSSLNDLTEALPEDGPGICPEDVSILSWAGGIVLHAERQLM